MAEMMGLRTVQFTARVTQLGEGLFRTTECVSGAECQNGATLFTFGRRGITEDLMRAAAEGLQVDVTGDTSTMAGTPNIDIRVMSTRLLELPAAPMAAPPPAAPPTPAPPAGASACVADCLTRELGIPADTAAMLLATCGLMTTTVFGLPVLCLSAMTLLPVGGFERCFQQCGVPTGLETQGSGSDPAGGWHDTWVGRVVPALITSAAAGATHALATPAGSILLRAAHPTSLDQLISAARTGQPVMVTAVPLDSSGRILLVISVRCPVPSSTWTRTCPACQ